MNILIPVGNFCRTGGYRVLSELANAWIRNNHKVSFLAPAYGDLPYFPTTAEIIWFDKNGDIVESKGSLGKGSIVQYYKMHKAINSIAEKYDVILANYCLTAFPVAFSSCRNVKKFYYIQAYEPEYFWDKKTFKSTVLGSLAKLTYHLPLMRIVNAPLYFRYKNVRSDKFVPPGLDLGIFKPDLNHEEEIGKKSTITIGCIGRIEPEKGTRYVIDAFERLSELDRRFSLRVAYGNLPSDWSHERCEVVIPKNDAELADFYRSVDILIAPGTLQHGAPHYPVLEAMACGTPVVSTKYYGANDDTAWVVENKSSESIADAVMNIVGNKELTRVRTINALKVIKEFDWDTVALKMSDYFGIAPARNMNK